MVHASGKGTTVTVQQVPPCCVEVRPSISAINHVSKRCEWPNFALSVTRGGSVENRAREESNHEEVGIVEKTLGSLRSSGRRVALNLVQSLLSPVR